MFRFLRTLGALSAFLLFLFSNSAAQVLDAVNVVGNRAVASSRILIVVDSEAGAPLDRATVERDIKSIFRMGFFRTVEATLDQSEGITRLNFVVREKPTIREVILKGNEEVSDDVFKEKMALDVNRFYDRRKIRTGIEAVKEHYQSKGFYGTTVDVQLTNELDSSVDLEIRVDEGQEQSIAKVSFEGNRSFDDDELEGVVSTAEYSWWSSWITGSGVVKQEALDTDVELLRQFYLKNGYVDVKIVKPVIQPAGDGLEVVYRLEEGNQYRIGKISARGTLLDGQVDKTIEDISLEAGDIFNVEKLRADTFTISEKFTDVGYAFANVTPLTRLNRPEQTVDIDFEVDKGSLIYVSRIEITGNRKTADNVVRRNLKIDENELFSSSKIKRSQQLLQRLGLFDEVSITPEPSQQPDTVDLNVSVREGSTGTFSAGAGISSGDGFIFSTRVSENNLFGTGNSLSFDINAGTRNENYIISFDNPRIRDSYWSGGINLLAVSREFEDFDRAQRGGSISVGYPLWFLDEEYFDDVQFGLRYEFLDIEIDNVEDDAPQLVQDQAGTSTSSSITPRIVRNTINNPLDPTDGSRQVGSIEVAGLGGDQNFWLFSFNNTIYRPVVDFGDGELVFSQRTRFGYGETFDSEDFPLFRRFFPGGINSVRGYDARELGPEDEDGNEFGGNKELIGNFELIFPLLTEVGLKGVVFYDIGNAFDDEQAIEFSELRQAFGWGIRWRSPLAPIRIEIGYPIDKEEGDNSVVTNFSFGAPL